MIKIDNTLTFGFEAAIRGMRNPMNSWDKSDSIFDGDYYPDCAFIGENDKKLMIKLAKSGSDHRKYMRMINVTADILAPLYWWKEYDTYKVGTVANSCSTMHKILDKEFTFDDFSIEHLFETTKMHLSNTIKILNIWRNECLHYKQKSEDSKPQKDCWWQIIQLLPSSYNQLRTVQLNYEVLYHIYFARKGHKLDEWREFCEWIKTLPLMNEIINESENNDVY